MMERGPRVSEIAAIGRSRELGKNDRLLWEIPEDAQFFRDMTRGHVNIMGRKTYESLLHYYKGKPLPKRVSVVITRDEKYKDQVPEGVFVFNDISDAINFAKRKEEEISNVDEFRDARDERAQDPEVFNIGGAQIFTLGLPFADRLYITFVDGEFPEADAYFPEFPEFKRVVEEKESQDENYSYTFKTLER